MSNVKPASDDDARYVLSLFHGLIKVQSPAPTMRGIAEEVAARHRMTLEDIRGVSRSPAHAIARHEAFALCRATGRFSTTQIGAYFGGRDHSTVIYGARRHKARQAAQ